MPDAEGYVPHILVYGDTGTNKSTFAATGPKPMLVSMFDPMGKDMPYLRRGKVGVSGHDACGVHFKVVVNKQDDVIIRLEYFYDRQPTAGPKHVYAFERFIERLDTIEEEIQTGQWASYVIDSLSLMQYACLVYNQYKKNPQSKSGATQDARQWHMDTAHEVQMLVNSRIAWFPIPVIVTAHVQDKADAVRGELVYLPAAPGQTPRRLPAAFSEVYYSYMDAEGLPWLQTRKSDKYIATSQFPAPNPCIPHYQALKMTAEEHAAHLHNQQ